MCELSKGKYLKMRAQSRVKALQVVKGVCKGDITSHNNRKKDVIRWQKDDRNGNVLEYSNNFCFWIKYTYYRIALVFEVKTLSTIFEFQ